MHPQTSGKTRLRALLLALVVGLLAGCSPGAPAGRSSTSAGAARAGLTGESKAVYSYRKAVRETVWVDTGLDGDGDGRTDRVAADIVRPREPAAEGRKVPVVLEASPYYSCCGRGNENQKKSYDTQGRPVLMPLFYDNYFVPRGYAFVAVDLPGSARSDGCLDAGGRYEVQSAKAVIDWLGGRAHAYTTRTGTVRATASWTDGTTGMIGKSWDGSIANGVAATGVKGLKTIVPISSISNWYDAFNSQGAPWLGNAPSPGTLVRIAERDDRRTPCAAVNASLKDPALKSGDWGPVWTERDYAAEAGKVKASVFLVQGLQDMTVRTVQLGQWWDALGKAGVRRKLWLSQTGHVDPFDYRRSAWVETLHRWFDHELLGYANGIEDDPVADVERSPGHWVTSTAWPPSGTATVTLHPGKGTLGSGTASGTETFTDDPGHGEGDWVASAGEHTSDKLAFTTAPLGHGLRLAGSSEVTVKVSATTPTAYLTADLIDLGPATIRDYDGTGLGIRTLTARDCWGQSTAGDSACFKKTAADTEHVGATVVSRGWADLGTSTDARKGQPLTPGTPYTLTVDLAPTDHVVPAGHRLALIVAGTDRGRIDPPADRPTFTLDLSGTSLRVPVVGGAGATGRAF